MKLSQQHIEQLYTFTRKHYVEYYDVQAELVDHLANDIETIWKEDKHLTFEQARDKAFKKFGVFGFMDVIAAKEKEMRKRYRKITWHFHKYCLTIPQIYILLFLTALYTILFSNVLLILMVHLISFLYFIYELVFLTRTRVKKMQEIQKKEKPYLLEVLIAESQTSLKSGALVIVLGTISFFREAIVNLELYWVVLIALCCALVTISIYLASIVIPKIRKEMLDETIQNTYCYNNIL